MGMGERQIGLDQKIPSDSAMAGGWDKEKESEAVAGPVAIFSLQRLSENL
jgi:hypothetical protein